MNDDDSLVGGWALSSTMYFLPVSCFLFDTLLICDRKPGINRVQTVAVGEDDKLRQTDGGGGDGRGVGARPRRRPGAGQSQRQQATQLGLVVGADPSQLEEDLATLAHVTTGLDWRADNVRC